MPILSAQERLQTRFAELRANGLRDFKIQYAPTSHSKTTLEDLCEEVLSILDAHEAGAFVDIDLKLL